MRRRRRFSRRGPRPNYMFKSRLFWGTLKSDAGTEIGQAFEFKLNDVIDASTYINMYDMYKICAVKFEVEPMGNVNTALLYSPEGMAQVPVQFGLPDVWTATDPTGTWSVSNEEDIMQYATARRTRAGRIHKRFFKPMWASLAYDNGGSPGYSPRRGYITCDDPAVPHYGVFVYLPNPNPDTTTAYENRMTHRIYITYYLKFKNKR